MAYSKAQMRSVQKYNKNNYDDIKLRVPKGEREKLKEEISALGYSFNQFMYLAMKEKIEREKGVL